MLTFKVRTDLSEALAAAIGKAATRAEHIVAVQAAKDTSPYVPFLTGSLDERTRVSGNTIIYPGPYARYPCWRSQQACMLPSPEQEAAR